MKKSLSILALLCLIIIKAQGQFFNEEIRYVKLDGTLDSVDLGYKNPTSPTISVSIDGVTVANQTLVPNTVNAPSGEVKLKFNKDEKDVKPIKLLAKNGTTKIDSLMVYLIPKDKVDGMVKFDAANPKEIDEPDEGENGFIEKLFVVRISKEFPAATKFTLHGDFQNTSNTNVEVEEMTRTHKPGEETSLVIKVKLKGNSNVTDNTKLTLKVSDESKEWKATWTVDIKSHERKDKVSNYNYYLSLGGSYDFLRNSQRVETYSDAFVMTNPFSLRSIEFREKYPNRTVTKKDKTTFTKQRHYQRWSISGQYFAATVVSTRDSLNRTTEFIPLKASSSDSVNVITGSGKQILLRSSDFFSVHGRVNYDLFPSLHATNMNLWLFLNFEVMERNSKSKFETVGSPDYDTTLVAITDLKPLEDYNTADQVFRTIESERSRTEGYLGVGLRYQWDTEQLRLTIDESFGYTQFDLRYYNMNGMENWSDMYFNSSFSLIVKSIGVKIGGDVRAKIKPTSATDPQGWRPLTTLYLSKTFAFTKIRDLFINN